MKKRVLSLLLCFVLAAGLLSVCAPPAQAGTIADAFELFIKQPGQIKKLFGREVAHGDCGPAGDEASVHYKIYEVTNPTVVQDNPFLQQIWQIHDYREDAQYYGVYIFGDGKMADYAATGQKAPWMGNVEVTEYNDKGQVLGTTVVENLGEEYLALAYIADGTDEEWDGRTERYSGVTNVGARAFKDCRYLTCMFLNDDITPSAIPHFIKTSTSRPSICRASSSSSTSTPSTAATRSRSCARATAAACAALRTTRFTAVPCSPSCACRKA